MFSRYWLCFRKWIFPCLAVGVVLLASFKGPYSLWRIYQFRKQRDQIKSDILQLSEENKLLRQEIQKLRTDPGCVSRIAREELGLVKQGEIIYRYHHQQDRQQQDRQQQDRQQQQNQQQQNQQLQNQQLRNQQPQNQQFQKRGAGK